MELKHKSIVETHELKREKNELMRIVNAVFGTELLAERRYQSNVEARMVFSKILTERGHSVVSIGRFLNKNHSTIIYYNRNLSNLLEQLPNLFRQYIECKESFSNGREPVVEMREREMKMKLLKLKEMSDTLSKENIELKTALKKYRRHEKIVELLCSSVKVGDESSVYNRINAMLNYR